MTDIELIIKIPEDIYKDIIENGFIYDEDNEIVTDVIKNGTPLPKGHSRLVYADDVKANHERWLGYLDDDMIARLNIAVDKHIRTVIEADKAESEVQE